MREAPQFPFPHTTKERISPCKGDVLLHGVQSRISQEYQMQPPPSITFDALVTGLPPSNNKTCYSFAIPSVDVTENAALKEPSWIYQAVCLSKLSRDSTTLVSLILQCKVWTIEKEQF